MNTIPEQKDYKNLTPFDLTLIQKFPFLEDDFDSINLYGILNKIKEYLNTVIYNTRHVIENQTNLYNYVKDYFTNLDVQEEINNKLDEMVEDGTLGTLIEEYVGLNFIYCYDNLASLSESEILKVNQKVKTLGFYNINDGGGACYYIRDTVPNTYYEELENGFYAELIIENNVINIKQLGAKPLDKDLNKTDIAPYINKYKTLNSNSKNIIKLYIPAGIWFTSGNKFINPNNCYIYGDGLFSYGSELAEGTIISSYEDNQEYIFKFGDESNYCQQFNISNLSFSTAEFIYDNELNRFKYSNLKTIESAVQFVLASYGITNNLHFIYVKGECISIKSTWEVFFGKLYFRYVSNHGGTIMRFKEGIGQWTNISACVFDYLMFESFHGDLITLENHCGLYNNHFNSINIEDRDFIESTETYVTITQQILNNWNYEDYNHLALFKLEEGARANGNIFESIELNNFPNKIMNYNNESYIYDIVLNYNDDVTFSNIFNNIVSQGMNKNLILFNADDYEHTNNQTPQFINLLNNSSFNFDLRLLGIDSVVIKSTLQGIYSTDTNNYIENGGWTPCYVTKDKRGTLKFLYTDSDAENIAKIVVKPRSEEVHRNVHSFKTTINYNKKIYLRAKIPNGEEVKLYLNDFTTPSGSKTNYIIGTGNYEIYELITNENTKVGDLVGVHFGGDEVGRELSRNISMDSFISV